MDPLSITASIIALVGAAGAICKTIKQIRDLQNAPKELQRVLYEAHMVRKCLSSVLHVLEANPSLSELHFEAVLETLNAAQSGANHLNDLINSSVSPIPNSREFKVNFLAYSRNRPKLKEAKEVLQSSRNNLIICLGSFNVNVTVEKTRALQNQINVATAALALNQAELVANVEQNTRLLQQLLLANEPNIVTIEEKSIQSSSLPIMPSSEKTSAPLLPLSNSPRCPVWCTCQCHRKAHITTLQGVSHVLGSLNLVVSGGLTGGGNCNDSSCRQRETSALHVSMFPPSWALARMISLSISTNPLTSLQISMKTPRLVCGSQSCVHLTLGGNIDALRRSFDEGRSSPFDIDARTGSSLLHLAAQNRHAPLFLALLAAGADSHQTDRNNRTPADIVWNYILHEDADKSLWTSFANKEDTSDLDIRQFSPLHKTVLRLTPVTLESHLTVSNEVNSRDFHGRTPLSWASARGDCAAVDALLRSGARTDLECTQTGKTPLHFAVEKGCVRCVKLLLEGGADINEIDLGQRTILHMAASSGISTIATKTPKQQTGIAVDDSTEKDQPDMLTVICRALPDIEARDATGATPLLLASGVGNVSVVEALLDMGADINAADNWGYTPFLQSLCYNYIDVWSLLLNRGANHQTVTDTSYNLAHLAAHYATAPALREMSKYRLEGIDILEKNRSGLTPNDIMKRSKLDATSELLIAFDHFLKSLT